MSKDKIVSIIMGSQSDYEIMKEASQFLDEVGIPHEITIVSAHRTPERLMEFSKNAEERGIEVIIAGAGGAAHLPGMVASVTALPVIGVPCKSRISIDGWDSMLSILQMPPGVPVATMALNGAKNAGILAAQICSTARPELRKKIHEHKKAMKDKVNRDIEAMEKNQ